MLTNLHVKNIALIDEVEIDFEKGFNTLTGETGAGKSILLGSVNLALGGKYSSDLLRDPRKPGIVELVFEIDSEARKKELRELDIEPEDGQVVITRRFNDRKSVLRINGETVTIAKVREAAELLIDIHGQHDSQTLLNKKNHLRIVDLFGNRELEKSRAAVKEAWKEKKRLESELFSLRSHGGSRSREISFLQYEIQEIEEASLIIGEDEELEKRYRKMSHGRKISENLAAAYQITGYDSGEGCGSRIGAALRYLQEIEKYDEPLKELYEQLITVDSLLNDFNRELSDYAESAEFSEEEFYEVETRLNEINRLKEKYGADIPGILDSCEKKKEELQKLEAFDENVRLLEEQLSGAESRLERNALNLSKERKSVAARLEQRIQENLLDLNFLTVEFQIAFGELSCAGENGKDDVEFQISMNPGEPLRSLGRIASGGELSRIMLAVKSVMADEDGTETLIFDEIDAGISGRTAQKIAEKIARLANRHQIICITHLAQIASMADAHFFIEKNTDQGRTWTSVRKLNEKESVEELARIIGGAQITETVLESAAEMKLLAKNKKNQE